MIIYTANSDHRGVFQHNLGKIKNFASFKGSSYSKSYTSNEMVVLYNDGNFWESDSINSSNFTISFVKHVMKLNSISLLSCVRSGCTKDIDVIGTNDGVYWDEVCKIRETYETFFQNISNVECISNRSYRIYQLIQVGKNNEGGYMFPIHYVDFFGELFEIKVPQQTCVNKHRNKISQNYIDVAYSFYK